MKIKYWLMKSEPDVFSISDLEKKGKFSSLRRHKDTYFITIAPNVFGSFGLQAVNAGIESNAVTVQPFTIVIIVSTSRKNKG
jgi:hypothetical protein